MAFHVIGKIFSDSHSRCYAPQLQPLGFGRVLPSWIRTCLHSSSLCSSFAIKDLHFESFSVEPSCCSALPPEACMWPPESCFYHGVL